MTKNKICINPERTLGIYPVSQTEVGLKAHSLLLTAFQMATIPKQCSRSSVRKQLNLVALSSTQLIESLKQKGQKIEASLGQIPHLKPTFAT